MTGGTRGVTRVGAASLRSWEGEQQDPIDFTEFGRADGFLTEECGGGYPNMTTNQDGKLWVATLGGAAMLDLSRLPPAAGKPFEYISEVEVDRKKRNAGRELILPPGLHHTELQLGSIELSSPERAHIQYRLEGIDSEWLDAKPDGAAVYTTIPHGTYLLHVRARNGDGVWDRQGIVYQVTQESFAYQTALFQALGMAAFLGMLCELYWCRMRRVAHDSIFGWRGASPSGHALLASCTTSKRQSNGIYAQASFGAEVESWWHREGSSTSTGAERKRIS
jgi:hypothetical protein